jgi:hypothetical protein
VIIAGIDPGLRHCGLAVYDLGQIVLARLVKNPAKGRGPMAWIAMAQEVAKQYPTAYDILVVENMQKDGRPFAADDVFEVQGVAGATAALVLATKTVGAKPREWTNGVPKRIRHRRLLKKPIPALEPAGLLTHNILDAIGLAQWYIDLHSPKAAYEIDR